MRRTTLLLALAVLLACGPRSSSTPASSPTSESPNPLVAPSSSPTGTTSAAPSASPGTASGLFVVLEARGSGSTFGGGPDAYDSHDVVAIAGIDGYAKARATFKPRTLPFIGPAGPLMQPEARVANGAVFYVDGDGAVRRLDKAGATTLIARFPAGQPQQEISFAVSQDGNHLVASVLTLPAQNPNYSMSCGCGPWVAGSHGSVELFAADSGGQVRSLQKIDLGSGDKLAPAMRVVGWDQTGPIVTLQMNLGSQQGSLGNSFEGCCLAHLDSTGRAGTPLTGNDCYAWQVGIDGNILCGSQNYDRLWLVDRTGHTAGTVQTPGQGALFLALSPDGALVASHGQIFSLKGSTPVTLPSTFYPEGWLDSSTIIGYQVGAVGAGVGNMALVRVANPGQLIDLGFTGIFVSTI
jgi:hypothetical protein